MSTRNRAVTFAIGIATAAAAFAVAPAAQAAFNPTTDPVASTRITSTTPAAAETSQTASTPSTVGGGNQVVAVEVAPVLVAAHDGLPARLAPHRSYTASFTVLATQSGSLASASVSAQGANVTGCEPVSLTPGTSAHLRCTVTATGDSPVIITVNATGGQGSQVAKQFRHTVGS